MAQDISKTTVKKKHIEKPVHSPPHRPENGQMSKADFVEWRKTDREARKEAQKLYDEKMAKISPKNPKLVEADSEVRKNRQLVSSLAKNLGTLEAELKDAAPGEITGLKKDINKLKAKIELAEEKLDAAEKEYNKIKKG